MRLRKQLLSPGAGSSSGRGREDAQPYDGRADQRLILQNLELVAPLERVIGHLYDVMFQRRPYLRPLFPDSMDFQQLRLSQMLTYLIENMHRSEMTADMFRQLGRDHRKLGVLPVHYDTFEDALREALRIRGGPQWTDELEQAWIRMLRFSVKFMIEGADASITEPPAWHAEVVGHERRRPDLTVLQVRTGEPYPYRAGQHGALETPLLPHTWRQYSMASAPRPDNVLEFHVRLTHRGGVSDALVDRTRVGDTLKVGPAHGLMTVDDDVSRDLLLVAGGTGLAPMKAILDELAARRLGDRRVHLFVGARDRADLYDWDELAEMDRRWRWLEVVPVISDEPQHRGETGLVSDALNRYGDWSQHVAYVSGPAGMVGATVRELIRLNVPVEQIRHDPLPNSSGE
jgi:NAD(P)H-flavin reductase/hemoglobin-like flavoprotein